MSTKIPSLVMAVFVYPPRSDDQEATSIRRVKIGMVSQIRNPIKLSSESNKPEEERLELGFAGLCVYRLELEHPRLKFEG